jgi:hypothetical protein
MPRIVIVILLYDSQLTPHKKNYNLSRSNVVKFFNKLFIFAVNELQDQ